MIGGACADAARSAGGSFQDLVQMTLLEIALRPWNTATRLYNDGIFRCANTVMRSRECGDNADSRIMLAPHPKEEVLYFDQIGQE